jgi:hypothetical protein
VTGVENKHPKDLDPGTGKTSAEPGGLLGGRDLGSLGCDVRRFGDLADAVTFSSRHETSLGGRTLVDEKNAQGSPRSDDRGSG